MTTFIIVDDDLKIIKAIERKTVKKVSSLFPDSKTSEYLNGLVFSIEYFELRRKFPQEEVVIILDGQMGGGELDGDVALKNIREEENRNPSWRKAFVIIHSSDRDTSERMNKIGNGSYAAYTAITNKLPTLLEQHLVQFAETASASAARSNSEHCAAERIVETPTNAALQQPLHQDISSHFSQEPLTFQLNSLTQSSPVAQPRHNPPSPLTNSGAKTKQAISFFIQRGVNNTSSQSAPPNAEARVTVRSTSH